MNNSWSLADHAAPGADLGARQRGLLWDGAFSQGAPRNKGIFLLLKHWELENTLGSQCQWASWCEGRSAASSHTC